MPLSSLTVPISLPASSSSSKKRRRAIINADKIEIRQYYFNKTHNKRPTLKALQAWYEDKHPHRPIAISSLSEITSSKYNRLDDQNIAAVSNYSWLREAAYPDLKAALYQFQLRMTQKGATITGEILQEIAQRI
jgi:Fission yeast centromere protein N-terminal domain